MRLCPDHMPTVGDRVPIGTPCPMCESPTLRAEVERLKGDGAGDARQIHGQYEKIRALELQNRDLQSALEEMMKIASQWGGCADTGTESPFGMTWTLDPSERKDWDNAMLGAERVLNATPGKPKCECSYSPWRYCPAHPSGPEKLVEERGKCIDCGKPVTSGNICVPCVGVRYPDTKKRVEGS